MMQQKIKVLVVDDSALVRQTLTSILDSDPGIEVIGSAADPFAAAKKMEVEIPDVITLDIEMPRMDGLTFLRKIMTQHPIPVVICSSLTERGSDEAVKALEYGAVDIITKPRMGAKKFLEESTIRVCDAVKAAAMTRAKKIKLAPRPMDVSPKLDADAVLPKVKTRPTSLTTTEKVLLVGASTGGTEALRVFLEALPLDTPGVVIVQHMPEHFTAAFARRLDGMCRINILEAKDNDTVLRGQALIAPGNKHTLLKRSGARYYVEVKDGPLVSRHRPSVDVLFRSGATYAGKNVVAAIMTGMGDDGARGMRELFDSGAYCIAQDEATSVVFGMPQEAIKREAVHKVLPLQSIAVEMLRQAGGR
jgi:two-component system chemotaxis response regulator CheB